MRSIVSLAHDLGLTVIGEGIELVEQLSTLRELGCDYGQGFFFSAACRPTWRPACSGRA